MLNTSLFERNGVAKAHLRYWQCELLMWWNASNSCRIATTGTLALPCAASVLLWGAKHLHTPLQALSVHHGLHKSNSSQGKRWVRVRWIYGPGAPEARGGGQSSMKQTWQDGDTQVAVSVSLCVTPLRVMLVCVCAPQIWAVTRGEVTHWQNLSSLMLLWKTVRSHYPVNHMQGPLCPITRPGEGEISADSRCDEWAVARWFHIWHMSELLNSLVSIRTSHLRKFSADSQARGRS